MRKKLFLLFLTVGISIVFAGSNSFGFSVINNWTLDLSAIDSNLGTQTNIQYINWNSPGLNTTQITQFLGADGILNNGDTFIETGYMSTFSVGANGGVDTLLDLSGTTANYRLLVSFVDLTGSISNYDNKSDLDPTNDTWDYTFDNGGPIKLYIDDNLTTWNDGLGEITLLSGIVVPLSDGTSDGFLNSTAPTSNWGITTNITSAYLGVFLDSVGNDLWTLFGPQGWLMASSQGVTELDGPVTIGTKLNPITEQEELYYFFSGHTGDTTKLGVVPEPTTMLLLGTGLIGLAAAGRRKFFKKS